MRTKVTVERDYEGGCTTSYTWDYTGNDSDAMVLPQLLSVAFMGESGGLDDFGLLGAIEDLDTRDVRIGNDVLLALAVAHRHCEYTTPLDQCVSIRIDAEKLGSGNRGRKSMVKDLAALAKLDCVEIVNMPDKTEPSHD